MRRFSDDCGEPIEGLCSGGHNRERPRRIRTVSRWRWLAGVFALVLGGPLVSSPAEASGFRLFRHRAPRCEQRIYVPRPFVMPCPTARVPFCPPPIYGYASPVYNYAPPTCWVPQAPAMAPYHYQPMPQIGAPQAPVIVSPTIPYSGGQFLPEGPYRPFSPDYRDVDGSPLRSPYPAPLVPMLPAEGYPFEPPPEATSIGGDPPPSYRGGDPIPSRPSNPPR